MTFEQLEIGEKFMTGEDDQIWMKVGKNTAVPAFCGFVWVAQGQEIRLLQ